MRERKRGREGKIEGKREQRKRECDILYIYIIYIYIILHIYILYYIYIYRNAYHERECDACNLNTLDDPHESGTGELNGCEEVYTRRLDVTEVDVVGLVLGRHKDYEDPFDELYTKHRDWLS